MQNTGTPAGSITTMVMPPISTASTVFFAALITVEARVSAR
jgi:hypothetical protein